jgi:succinate dehydrogenase/fumarate reductase flavoprotein subunit
VVVDVEQPGPRVVIVGGGIAGLIAAISAAAVIATCDAKVERVWIVRNPDELQHLTIGP